MLITVDKVTKTYLGDQIPTIDNLSIEVGSGVSSILLDIQSGKSTLAKLMVGLIAPTSGEVYYCGTSTTEQQPRDIVLVGSGLTLMPNKRVWYNVAYPLIVRGQPKAQARQLAVQHLQQCSLGHLADTVAKQLNADDTLQVMLARATVRKSNVIVLDDTVTLLDSQQVDQLIQRLLSYTNNIIILTSDATKCRGSCQLVVDSKVIASGNRDDMTKATKEILWLYNATKE